MPPQSAISRRLESLRRGELPSVGSSRQALDQDEATGAPNSVET